MSAPAGYEGRHARPRQPGPVAAWLRRTARNLLWAAGDRLCARPLTFPAGNWLGELGWTLSGPFRLTPAPAGRPVQAVPRPADPPRCCAARCGPGQPHAPGAVAAGTGTDAGATPSPAAVATTPPGGAAQLPPTAPPRDYPGRGQHPYDGRPAWVTCAGDHPMPGYRGDYRPTQPMRAVGPAACNIFRPYYPELERWRDSTRRTA